FQLFISVPFRALGFSHEHTAWVLAWMSTAAFVGILWLSWTTLARVSRPVAGAMVLCLLTGLPLHYATHSFAEMSGAFFTVWLVSSWLSGNSWGVLAAAFLAALTKETAAPFLALTCAIASGLSPEWKKKGARWLAAGAALTLGSTLCAAL